jgi:hypothetical protein
MRTTLVIDDALFCELKRRAAEERRTLSEVTQEVLRRGLARPSRAGRRKRVRLRTFAMGRPTVDLANRERLHDLLDRG